MAGYQSAVRLHISPVLGTKRLDKLKGNDVRALIAVCRGKCLCCANGYDKHRPDDTKCYSVGKCCGSLAEAKKTRLYALYVVAATLGLRRGELLGLRWEELDLEARTLTVAHTVQRVGGRLRLDATKSEASDATVPLPQITRRVLLAHRGQQAKERVDAGEIWHNHGLVFPTSIGTPMEPRSLGRHFEGIRTRAGFPTVRLHDFRHTVVTLLLELGTPPHVVKAIAGMRTST